MSQNNLNKKNDNLLMFIFFLDMNWLIRYIFLIQNVYICKSYWLLDETVYLYRSCLIQELLGITLVYFIG